MFILRYIAHWFRSLAATYAREWRTVLHDQGALIFFIVLPVLYPVVYTLIYNPEVVRKMPVAVIDNDRTATSRQLVRDASASPVIEIYNYVPDMAAAKDLLAQGKVYGVLQIPQGFGRKIGRMEQSHATFYCQMSLLLRYRWYMTALSDVQLKEIGDITQQRKDMLGSAGSAMGGAPLENRANMLGDTQQGFASFIMPGIVVLILQQSMVLGICLLGGTSNERRRLNRGIDPQMVPNAPASAVVWGRTLCYTVFYIAPTMFLLHYIPVMFSLPHAGSAVQYLLFALPLLLASAFFGQTLARFVTDRESSFVLMVVTSVIFLFLSGLTWPRYAFPEIWRLLGDMVPGVWGVQGFISINSLGATLADTAGSYLWLWALTGIYFVTAWLLLRWRKKRA